MVPKGATLPHEKKDQVDWSAILFPSDEEVPACLVLSYNPVIKLLSAGLRTIALAHDAIQCRYKRDRRR